MKIKKLDSNSPRIYNTLMSIRVKIILVVLPLLIVTLALAGVLSHRVATTSVNRVIQELLDFKVFELRKYAEGQWQLLVENNLTARPEMVDAAKAGVETFAYSILRGESEIILAFDSAGAQTMATSPIQVQPQEQEALLKLVQSHSSNLATLPLGGIPRVGKGFYFAPFDWYILISQPLEAFYSDIQRITRQTAIILAVASTLSVALLLWFSRLLTSPLGRVVEAMRRIIGTSDLSSRVAVEFKDETGELAHTFNVMTGELEKAYQQIKRYAYKAVLANKRETKIRHIFQKYVPQELIDKFFKHPEAMLVGDNRELAVLFSDIRGFTTISEGMLPDELVNSLNRYFSGQVDIVMNRGGIVDKYIGDAIMAFFGAPVQHQDDALQSVLAGIEMTEAVKTFNEGQRSMGKPEFKIGVGINYGTVTVGNIGSERKMEYTVIGDMVNLASRLEGLTKVYRQELLIAESLHEKICESLDCRWLDTVAVKGKTKGVRIYTARKSLSPEQKQAWQSHNEGMELYYRREFSAAAERFRAVQSQLSGDYVSGLFVERCERLLRSPPPIEWDGVEVMAEK
jgi:class 3 adenylate cyclase/HAMP domain-containing protein